MTNTFDDKSATDTDADTDFVEITILVSRETYEKAKAIVDDLDPTTSPYGEFAGTFGVEEYLGNRLDIYFEDQKKHWPRAPFTRH